MSRRAAVNLALVAAVIALFAVPVALHLGTRGMPAGQAYGGTDDAARKGVEAVDPGYRPWFEPLMRPSSGQVESGLFALQAALGAGAFGFVLGRLSGRPGRSAPAARVAPAGPAGPPRPDGGDGG